MSSRYGNTPRQLQEHNKQWEEEWSEYFWNEFVLKYEDKLWIEELSSNPNITMEIVKENPDKP